MTDRHVRGFELTDSNVVSNVTDQYIIEGRAIHYNSPTLIRGKDSKGEIVEWYETIAPDALVSCDTSDVPMLLEHDRKEVIARSRNKSLEFSNKPDGLHIMAKMLTGKGREVWESVRAGLLTSFSFAFPLDSEIVRDGQYDGLPLIRVTGIKKLLDVSVVFAPAYKGAFANARSADWIDALVRRDRQKQRIMILLEANKNDIPRN